MAMNDWSEKTRLIVTAAVVVVVNAAFGAGLYYIRGEWKKLDARHTTLSAEKKKLEEFVQQGPERDLELKQYTERFDKQAKLLPETSEVATLLSDISKVTSATTCKNISFTNTKGASGAGGGFSAKNYAREVWKTKWEGDFMSWCKLMNEIEERFPRFMAFENLTLTPESSLSVTGAVHDISVDMVTYRYVPQPGSK